MIIVNASDPVAILNKFKSAFRPMSWSGSRADIMQRHMCLIEELKTHEDPLVSRWAIKTEFELIKEISSEKEWESKSDRSRDESFE